MSQVRGDPLGLAESHERDVSAAQDDVLSPGGDEEAQEEHLPDEEKLETETDNVEKETCLPPLRNGTSCLHELMEPTILTEAELVTCQPQVQSRLNDELEENKTGTDTVLMNGMKHMAGQNSVKYGVENGAPSQVIQSPPNSQTSHRKLQSNPSINSHSSKKSHSSSKSTTSQIPADAHEEPEEIAQHRGQGVTE